MGKKRKKVIYNTGYLVTHPSTNEIEQGLIFLLSELNMLLSLWYRDYAERFFKIS